VTAQASKATLNDKTFKEKLLFNCMVDILTKRQSC